MVFISFFINSKKSAFPKMPIFLGVYTPRYFPTRFTHVTNYIFIILQNFNFAINFEKLFQKSFDKILQIII